MKRMPTIIPVVAVALIDPAGQVLMQQRRCGADHGGLWEFPGGKVEPGETLESALCREIAEELGITLDPAALVPLSFATSPEQPHEISAALREATRKIVRSYGGIDRIDYHANILVSRTRGCTESRLPLGCRTVRAALMLRRNKPQLTTCPLNPELPEGCVRS